MMGMVLRSLCPFEKVVEMNTCFYLYSLAVCIKS